VRLLGVLMAKGNSHHVMPEPSGGWVGKRAGAKHALKHFKTKKEAVGYMRGVSQRQETELVIHRKDGTIEKRDSHGHDPRNVPG